MEVAGQQFVVLMEQLTFSGNLTIARLTGCTGYYWYPLPCINKLKWHLSVSFNLPAKLFMPYSIFPAVPSLPSSTGFPRC